MIQKYVYIVEENVQYNGHVILIGIYDNIEKAKKNILNKKTFLGWKFENDKYCETIWPDNYNDAYYTITRIRLNYKINRW
jgi:hypothetical protein